MLEDSKQFLNQVNTLKLISSSILLGYFLKNVLKMWEVTNHHLWKFKGQGCDF